MCFFFFKQKTAYEMRISDWSSDVCSSDLAIDDAAALDAQCLVLVVGGMPAGSRDLAGARAQVQDGIAAVLEHAKVAGVPLAIEQNGSASCRERVCQYV